MAHLNMDGLLNAVSGVGTARDPRTANSYSYTGEMTREALIAAWHSSGMIRKIVRIPANDMVREWRTWNAPPEDVRALEAAERKLGVRVKVREAEVLRGRGGGVIVMGLPGNLASPAPPTIGKGALSYLNVLSRWQLSFQERIDDSSSPLFGEPAMWEVPRASGVSQQVHPSRVIAFRGDTGGAMADLSGVANALDSYWGDSIVAQIHDAVMDSDTARAAFANMLNKASRLRIGIPDLMELLREEGGEARLMTRLAALAKGETNLNATLYDAGNGSTNPGEQLTDAVYSFAGAKDMLQAYSEFVCAVADIPATRLFGRAPEGLNSSGDSQQSDWNKMVKGRQELDLEPCMDKLDPYLIQHALGRKNDDGEITFAWSPLDTPGAKSEAERFKLDIEAIAGLQNTGAIPEPAFTLAVQSKMIEEGYLPALESELAKIPEEQRAGIEQGAEPPQAEPQLPPGDMPLDDPRMMAANDARPRTLYVSRTLLNADELIAWAKAQGLQTTLAASDMHVTIAYSRQAIDWFSVEDVWGDETITVKGGPRVVERLGDGGAVALLFASSQLGWRHEQIKRAGATWDWDEYQPHVTITWNAPDIDVDTLQAFKGELRFGPEIWAELDPNWQAGIKES